MRNALLTEWFRAVMHTFLLPGLFLTLHPAQADTLAWQSDTSGESSGILPVSLGVPDGCFFASAYAMNSGAYPEELVVAGSVTCPDSDGPAAWRSNNWSYLELPEGNYSMGYSESVNDNPADEPMFTYHIVDEDAFEWDTWVSSPDQAPAELPLLPDMTHIGKAILSAQGNHIVGGNSNDDLGLERGVRWARDGADWLPPEDVGPGEAVATTEDGSVVIGNTGGRWSYWGDGGPWVWTANPGGGGEITLLEPEAIVYDITHSGSLIVGAHPKACSTPQCDFIPAPAYWVLENGQWTMHDLQALDGVDSEAQYVADVNGQAVIVGYGFTNQNGGIMRVVAWIPEADGSYGPPLRLEALGGNFDSISWPIDVNRNGLVLGWSEKEPFGATNEVVWSLFGQLPFQINAGLNDSWFNPETPGHGFFISVFPERQTMFLAWFTYDTERPAPGVGALLGEPGHRWLTAYGPYSGDTATLEVELSQGGVFESAEPAVAQTESYGSIEVTFSGCNAGTVSYDIAAAGVSGQVPIERIALDNVSMCQSLAAQIQQSR